MCRVPPRTAALKVLEALETASQQEPSNRTGITFTPEDWCIGRAYETFRPLEELDAAAISQLSSGQHQLQYMVRLSKALMESASELLGLYTRTLEPVVSKLSKGLTSLPDELLAIIFKFATHHHEEGTRHAMWLSQVSRRFRGIVLVDPILWSTLCLWYDTTNENIKRCIRRSGKDSDLHVVINYNRFISSSALRNFLDTCSSSASRWRSLTLDGDWNMGDDQNLHSIGISLSQLLNQHSLVLPRLHELCLSERCLEKGDPSWVGFAPTFDASRPWATRNIRVLRCIQCIPPSSLPFTSLTSFTLSLNLLPDFLLTQAQELLEFVASKTSISEFVLELAILDGYDYSFDDHANIVETYFCPSLVSFHLCLSNFPIPDGVFFLPEAFVWSLRMPKLQRFSLSFKLSDSHMERYGLVDPVLLLGVPRFLLPDPLLHPLISSLTIEVAPISQFKRDLISRNAAAVVLTIPFEICPQISSLCVTTFGQLSLTFNNQDGDLDGPVPLRELQLRSCRGMNREGLQGLVQSLEDLDAFEELNRVVIKGCDLLDYETAAEVIGEETLDFAR